MKSTQEKMKDPPLLVIDYAVGGSTVTDGIDQVDDGFMTQIAKRPLTRTMHWTEENTLFSTPISRPSMNISTLTILSPLSSLLVRN